MYPELKFIQISDMLWEAKYLREKLDYIIVSLGLNYEDEDYKYEIKDFQEDLVADLIIRVLALELTKKFKESGLRITNKMDLINVVVKKEELENDYNINLSNDDLYFNIGYFKDRDVDGEIKNKLIFGRCDK